MEDAFDDADVKAIVHAAIGTVLIDMCAGPALLQLALRNVEKEAATSATRLLLDAAASSSATSTSLADQAHAFTEHAKSAL